jgi:hypothetical protein
METALFHPVSAPTPAPATSARQVRAADLALVAVPPALALDPPPPALALDAPPPRTSGVPLAADDLASRAFLAVADGLARYHRHRVLHLDGLVRLLRSGRRVIVVANHALNIIDPLLFVRAVQRRAGVVPRFIAHPAWLRVPVLRDVAQKYRVIPSRDRARATQALAEDGFLMLFPGAVREAALRDYHREPYRLFWADRLGFLDLALAHDAEIVFCATVGNDEMYYQSRIPLPSALLALLSDGAGERYRGARLGLGLTGPHLVPGLFPLPVQVTQVVSAPLDLGDRQRARADAEVRAALHRRLTAECQALLDNAVAGHRRRADRGDRAVRAAQGLLRELGL